MPPKLGKPPPRSLKGKEMRSRDGRLGGIARAHVWPASPRGDFFSLAFFESARTPCFWVTASRGLLCRRRPRKASPGARSGPAGPRLSSSSRSSSSDGAPLGPEFVFAAFLWARASALAKFFAINHAT